MSHTKTKKTPQPSSLQAKEIKLKAPTKWSELTQEQLRYVLTLLAIYDVAAVKTYMFVRFCNLDILGLYPDGYKCVHREGKDKRVFYLKTWQVASFIDQLSFIERPEEYDVRLESIGEYKARDLLLHDTSFLDYSIAEKNFQYYVRTHDTKYIDRLLDILYRPAEEFEEGNNSSLHTPRSSLKKTPRSSLKYSDAERVNAQFWFTHIRSVFNSVFKNLFRPDHTASITAEDYNPVAILNAQIRLLTGGDITKEDAVFEKDCWRALYELDAQAKEAADMKREMAKMKHN